MLLLVSDICDIVYFNHCISLHERTILLFFSSTIANINRYQYFHDINNKQSTITAYYPHYCNIPTNVRVNCSTVINVMDRSASIGSTFKIGNIYASELHNELEHIKYLQYGFHLD